MDIKNTPSKVDQAVALAGNVATLAAKCGISPQAVYKWLKRGKVPFDKWITVETALDNKMSRFDFMPPELIQTDRLKQS